LSERLPAWLEVSGVTRRAQSAGEFATILRKGDPERGSLLPILNWRGRHFACLERVLGVGGDYDWQVVGPADSANAQEVSDFLARRARFDEDLWAVELDVADPERFIAETIGSP
jgi:hypothetical protein